jgi:SAM-dependent methyltransferase
MNRFWNRALLPIADAVEPRRIVEVGAANGALTAKLLEWGAEHDAIVHSIDPHPEFDTATWSREHGKRFVFHQARSLNVLGRLDGVDMAFIDGDHNWFTVLHELRLLERVALRNEALPPLIALHDIDWPYGRRDQYYDPDSIPAAYRQPFEQRGIVPASGELADDGLNPYLNNAIYEHSIHNGVRTAIEDFVAESGLTWRFSQVPGLHGLGILATTERLAAHPRLDPLIESFQSAPFLADWCAEVEAVRIRAEIVIAARTGALGEATDRLEELARSCQELSAELDGHVTQKAELERRTADLLAALDRAAAERDELRKRHAGELQAAIAEHADTRQELQAAIAEHADTQQELQAAIAEHADTQQELQAAIAEHADTQQELQTAIAEHADTRQELQTAIAEHADTQQELQAAIAEHAKTLEELNRLTTQLAELRSRRKHMHEQLSAEIERLEQQAIAAAGIEGQLRRELTAAKTQSDEADEQRLASMDHSHNGTEIGAPVSSAGVLWASLTSALRSCDAGLTDTMAERDPAFSGDRDTYLAISRSALCAILPALAIAGIPRPETILDLPCGYGRVTRALRAAWPEAELTVADESTAAVAFCVEHFTAEAWEVDSYLEITEEEQRTGRYDVIWSASLLSSIKPTLIESCVSSLLAMLRPGGVLVAAYHGRDSARRFSEHDDESLRAVALAVNDIGVGFRARADSADLGTSAMTPQWLLPHLTQRRDAMVLSVTERGWADHLDVVAIARKDIHHPQVNPVLD